MAVTAQESDHFTTRPLRTTESHGRVRIAVASFTQSGDGDAGSTVDLWRVPPGRVRVLAHLSEIRTSAFGTGRTLDIGHAGYTGLDGAAVAADANDLSSGKAVATAQTYAPSFHKLFESVDGTVIQAKVAGGTIPDGATIDAVIAYVVD